VSDDKCHFCTATATKLCDKPMLNEHGMYDMDVGTCDLLLCDRCAKTLGKTFDMPGRPIIDTMDYCPFHAGVHRRYLIKSVK